MREGREKVRKGNSGGGRRDKGRKGGGGEAGRYVEVEKGRQASDAILFPVTLTTDFRKAGYVGVERRTRRTKSRFWE